MKLKTRFLSSLEPHITRITFVLLLGFLGVLIDIVPAIRALDQAHGLAWLFDWRGGVPVPDEVVVIALDQESARALGLPPKPNQWPRDVHARLIKQLAQAGASVIVFDLLFDNPGTLPSHDDAFASAIRAAGNVVLTESLVQERITVSDNSDRPLGQVAIEKTVLPITKLVNAAAGTACFPLPKNTRVDAAWLFKSGAGSTPTLPMLALQLHLRDTTSALHTLLQQYDAQFAASLSDDRAVLSQPGMAEKLMLQLRHYFVQQPARGHRLLQQLDAGGRIEPTQQRRLRALLKAYLGYEARYLNFYGPPRTITTIPYYQALQNNEIAAKTFRDKVIFIGYSASSISGQDRIRDDYDTVFSRNDGLHLSGVEIGATAFANALDDSFVRPLDVLARTGLLLGWGSMLALLALMPRGCHGRSAAAIVLLVTASYLTVAQQLFAHRTLWIPIIAPLFIQLPLALFAGLVSRHLAAKKEQLFLENVFSHFIPQTMVEKLAAHAPALGAVDSYFYGVCLATDASNYTSMAEKMEPMALTKLMNRYYAALFAPVAVHDGIVSDIKGDAMLAIWRCAASTSAVRTQACRAALDIHAIITDATGAVNIPATKQDLMLPTRIGLDFGPLTIGNVGAGQHFEYRAVGDTVNTASRIEGLNKQLGTWVLASEAVVDGLDGFLLRPLGSFLLRGKSIPVNVVEILDDKLDAAARDRKTRLCQQFGDALALFQQRQWEHAESAFGALLANFTEDPPSLFYIRECVRKRTASAPDCEDSVIRIVEK